ncbi:hypothetical protein HX882_32085 [Pseudomonas gingeri]|uniref:Uncharacterized protein n=1 Tax=Pseudomonas gingeri TaxID=117681 RepID=A0A7Y7XIP4_9PSED|nr:hypothetical protein [Pseudomonas gingeri]NWC00521.1 hypothetical protein [Pseudomonas gingeri]
MSSPHSSANPLISYAVLCGMSILGVVMYLGPVSEYGAFNANLWRPHEAATSVMFSTLLFLVGGCFYVIREYGVDVKSFAESQMDVQALQGMRYLSLLSKHYADLTLICTLLVFVLWLLKSAVSVAGILLISFLMSFLTAAWLSVYLLIFVRTLQGSWYRHPVKIVALIGVLVFDAAFMVRAIALV